MKKFVRSIVGKRIIGFFKVPLIYFKFWCATISVSNERHNRILVFGLGRSGTTWISNKLTEKYNLIDYGEIFQFPSVFWHNILQERCCIPSNSSVKLLTYQVKENGLSISKIQNWINSNFDAVFVIERNQLDQVLSSIYSGATDIYHGEVPESLRSIYVEEELFNNRLKHNVEQKSLQEKVLRGFVGKVIRVNYEEVQATGHQIFDIGNNSHRTRARIHRVAKKLSQSSVRNRILNFDEVERWYYEKV